MDPWKILRISKTCGRKGIKKAYRKRCRQTHPDLNPEKSDEEFKKVAWAYRAITDPKKAGPCPVKRKPAKPKPKTQSKKEIDLNPEYARKDPTLRFFDDNLRKHLIGRPTIVETPVDPPPPTPTPRKRRRRRPIRRESVRKKGPPKTLDDLLASEKESSIYKKWAERMKAKQGRG